MSSYSITETTTFSLTDAKHMAAKVAADLKRMQRLYGKPEDSDIANYEAEVVALLKAGYLGKVTYGYKRYSDFIEPTLRYTARDLAGSAANDDDPGKVLPGADIAGATFYSFLTYNSAWHALSAAQQAIFNGGLPFQRGTADEPGIKGYLIDDRTYSAGGRALGRSSVRSL